MTTWNATRRMIVSTVILGTTAVMWTATTRAQFVVFDPSNYEEAVRAFREKRQPA